MRELTLHTAEVIERLRAERRPRAVVKHGRLQATLWPLEPGIESLLVRRALQSGYFTVGASGQSRLVDELLENEASDERTRVVEPTNRRESVYSTVSMTELNQKPSVVIGRVREGERLVVTRHGRFLALIVATPPGLESRLLASIPDFMATLDNGQRDGVGHGMLVDVAEAMTEQS